MRQSTFSLDRYAFVFYAVCLYKTFRKDIAMPRHTDQQAKLKRKSFFVDDRTLQRAKQALRVKTDAEVIRLSVERVVEMEAFWRFLQKSRHTLPPHSLEEP